MLRRILILSSILTFALALTAFAGDDAKADKAKKMEQAAKAAAVEGKDLKVKVMSKDGKETAYEKCPLSAQECLNQMTAKFKTSGWVGIEYEPAVNEEKASETWTITKVVPGSPAEAGGLVPGDIIFAMYGIEFSKATKEKLSQARKEWKPGQEVVYSVKRDGAEQQITVTLAAWPADVVAQWIGKHMMEHAQPLEDVAAADK